MGDPGQLFSTCLFAVNLLQAAWYEGEAGGISETLRTAAL